MESEAKVTIKIDGYDSPGEQKSRTIMQRTISLESNEKIYHA